MEKSIVLFCLLYIYAGIAAKGQRIEIFPENDRKASLRGLSAVSEKLVWVSGSEGTVGRSTDAGNTWEWITVPEYETRDFRDIEAFSATTAIIMAIGEPAVILKTVNGGKTWKKVYENSRKGMFLDAMEFWNEQSGMVIGDPVGVRFFVARSFDGGNTWRELPFDKLPQAEKGEACFAASGTNVRALDRDEACFVTGGRISRMVWKGLPAKLPLLQGEESQGANSIAVWNKGIGPVKIAVVGGDYRNDSSKAGNCSVSKDGGKSWIRPSNPPYGYRSCVEYVSATRLVTCGVNGVDVSFDEGVNWNSVSRTGFHVCRKSKKGNAVFLAGANGRVGRLVW